jgi:hypothetical protein
LFIWLLRTTHSKPTQASFKAPLDFLEVRSLDELMVQILVSQLLKLVKVRSQLLPLLLVTEEPEGVVDFHFHAVAN